MFMLSGVATELAVEACAINSFDVDLEFGSVSILTFQLVEYVFYTSKSKLDQKNIYRMLIFQAP